MISHFSNTKSDPQVYICSEKPQFYIYIDWLNDYGIWTCWYS